MKKLVTLFAAVVLSAQAGYCAGSALNGLEALGDAENISVPAAGAAKAMDGSAYKATQALELMSDLPGDTAHEKLKNLFNEGVPAVKEDLTGWYSGRRAHGSELTGALFIGKEMPSYGGPLLGEDLLGIVLLSSNTCEGYDNMSAELIDQLKKKPHQYVLTFPNDNALFPFTFGQIVIQYKKARGYLVEHFMEKFQDRIMGENYTYYFLNVTPKN